MIEIKDLEENKFNEELENIFYTLYGYKMKNIEAYYDYNGVKLYSKDITGIETLDKWYITIYGCTYTEHVQKKAEEMRPVWLEKGYALIAPEKHDKWTELVDNTIKNIAFYHVGNPIEDTLRIVERVNSMTDNEEIRQLLVSLDGSNNTLVKTAIEFSNKGHLLSEIYEEEIKTNKTK
jgi:hypothetical protein